MNNKVALHLPLSLRNSDFHLNEEIFTYCFFNLSLVIPNRLEIAHTMHFKLIRVDRCNAILCYYRYFTLVLCLRGWDWYRVKDHLIDLPSGDLQSNTSLANA